MDTDTAWELWGRRDPYYSVLTDPKYRTAMLTEAAKEEFFASGRHHVDHVLAMFRRYIEPAFAPQRVLDFGCGVGRLVIPFAENAKEVVGMDIAPSMLAQAKDNCDARGLTNVSIVMSDDTLSAAEGTFDLVHSCLVLQHMEVPRGRDIFARLVQKVRRGGGGAIQVTFGWDVYARTFGQVPPPPPSPPPAPLPSQIKRKLRGWLQPIVPTRESVALPVVESPDPEMQMNYYNLSELMFLLQAAGVEGVHTELVSHSGALAAFLFFQRGG